MRSHLPTEHPLASAPAPTPEAATTPAPAAGDVGALLTQAVAQGKAWLENIDLQQVLPPVRDFGKRVAGQVRRLSPAQQAAGGALLLAGLGWWALRSRTGSPNPTGRYESQPFQGKGKPKYAGS